MQPNLLFILLFVKLSTELLILFAISSNFFLCRVFSDETEASKKISEKFETNHQILEINNFLEELPKAISIVKQPFWDLHWYYLVKQMKKSADIFLSGDGGDELFGGYTFRYKKFLDLTNENSSTNEKILAYLNCHERDWVPDQELIFSDE